MDFPEFITLILKKIGLTRDCWKYLYRLHFGNLALDNRTWHYSMTDIRPTK
uniref:Uncharacterized protein n=1 Tax=Rhizophagus irregularis (strain DAOM 181602 / DAOM 197198 / MUCL 43194) TaxID=747089 RepID=U9TAU7_RHIID